MHTDITKMPLVDLRDSAKLAELIPSPTIQVLPLAVHRALTGIMEGLAPNDDPAPIAMALGWDAMRPTADVISIDARFLRDGNAKAQLAMGLRDMVLRRRAMEQETYAFAVVNASWFKTVPLPPGGLQVLRGRIDEMERTGIAGEADKIEVICCNVIWQDGQRLLLNQVRRREGQSPMLGDWRDLSAGTVMVKDRFWHAIAPALAATSYAEAVLAAFEAEGQEGQ